MPLADKIIFFSTLIFQLCDLTCILSLSGKTGDVIDTKYFDMWGGGTCHLHSVPAADGEPIWERTMPPFTFPPSGLNYVSGHI